MTIRLGLQGASGKTGSLVLSVLPEFPQYSLGAAVAAPGSMEIGRSAGGVAYTDDPSRSMELTDAWIDFSTPASSVALARLCGKHRKPLLIATTGLTELQREEIAGCAKSSPILIAPNTSLGVFALKELSSEAKRYLGPRFDIEVSEIHHRLKKDAPSGTALYLANELLGGREESLVHDRSSRHEERRPSEIGVTAIRGGDAAGEHTVYFIGSGERIELTHRVWDRRVFARGALALLERLLTKGSGLHSLSADLF